MLGEGEMDATLHYTSVSHADAMMTSINKMRLNTDLCDVTVVVGNFRIMAHRVVLSASAPFFYQTLHNSLSPPKYQNSGQPIFELYLEGVDVTAALKIIEFCYTSAISLTQDSVWPLLAASLKFELTEICSLCCDYLLAALDVSNCLIVQCRATDLKCAQLMTATAQFIQDNIEKLCSSPSLLTLPAPAVVEVTQSLSAARQSSQLLTRVMKAWLTFDLSGRGHAVHQFLQRFPDFHKELAMLYPEGLKDLISPDKTDRNGLDLAKPTPFSQQLKISFGGGGVPAPLAPQSFSESYEKSITQFHQQPTSLSTDQAHICVSCGDEFESSPELHLHQQCCEEAAQPVLLGLGGKPGHGFNVKDEHERSVLNGKEHQGNGIGGTDENADFEKKEGYNDGSFKEDAKLASPDLLSHPGQSDIFPKDGETYSASKEHDNNSESFQESSDSKLMRNVYQEDMKSDDADMNDSGVNLSTNQSHNDTNNNDVNNHQKDNVENHNDDEGQESDETIDVGHEENVGKDTGGVKNQDDNVFSKNNSETLSPPPSIIDRDASSRSMLGFKCQICSKGFIDRKSLSKHWKMTHGVDQSLGFNPEHTSLNQPPTPPHGFLATDFEEGEINYKKSKLAEGGSSDIVKPTPVKPNGVTSDASELFNQYVKQYQEFTKWCLEQGPIFCQQCMLYHPKGSHCPKSAGRPALDSNSVQLIKTEAESAESSNQMYEGEKTEVDQPLDMSKTSQDFSSSGYLSSTSRPSLPSSSPLDLSQYYNYARLMAGAAANNNGSDHNSQFRPGDLPKDMSQLYSPSGLQFPSPSSSTNPPSSFLPFGLSASGHDKNSFILNNAGNSAGGNKYPQLSGTHPNIPSDPTNQNLPGSQQHFRNPTNASRGGQKRRMSRQGFPCSVCSRVFSYQAALHTHMRTHSPGARTFQCTLCQESFARAPDLKVHVCPNGVEKPFTCPSCGQTFAKNIHLKRHLATHSGLKPYPCWVCGKRFSRSDHLKRHTQSIHAGSRPHACVVCGKEFVRKYELNKHMQMHALAGQVAPEMMPGGGPADQMTTGGAGQAMGQMIGSGVAAGQITGGVQAFGQTTSGAGQTSGQMTGNGQASGQMTGGAGQTSGQMTGGAGQASGQLTPGGQARVGTDQMPGGYVSQVGQALAPLGQMTVPQPIMFPGQMAAKGQANVTSAQMTKSQQAMAVYDFDQSSSLPVGPLGPMSGGQRSASPRGSPVGQSARSHEGIAQHGEGMGGNIDEGRV